MSHKAPVTPKKGMSSGELLLIAPSAEADSGRCRSRSAAVQVAAAAEACWRSQSIAGRVVAVAEARSACWHCGCEGLGSAAAGWGLPWWAWRLVIESQKSDGVPPTMGRGTARVDGRPL